MRGEGSSIGFLEILSKALQGRMLIKVRGCQIKLIGLIETISQFREGNRIKAIL